VTNPGAPSVHKARTSQAQGSCGDVQTATESEERLGSVRVLHQCKHAERDGAKQSMDEFWRKLDMEVQLQHRMSGAWSEGVKKRTGGVEGVKARKDMLIKDLRETNGVKGGRRISGTYAG
jgi:hypothetical protein